MPNYLSTIKYNFKKARKELEKALELIDGSGDRNVEVLQSLNVTDELAEVFKQKPVIIMQTMDVRILTINNRINAAMRALDQIDDYSLRAIGTVEGFKKELDDG